MTFLEHTAVFSGVATKNGHRHHSNHNRCTRRARACWCPFNAKIRVGMVSERIRFNMLDQAEGHTIFDGVDLANDLDHDQSVMIQPQNKEI